MPGKDLKLPLTLLVTASLSLLPGCVQQTVNTVVETTADNVKTLTQQLGNSQQAGTDDVQPPADPFLQIETGMHTAEIWQASLDQAGTRLLTVSGDKTARLWSVADGTLIRTFRAPIGPGDAGVLLAGTIARDGRWIAVGGKTAFESGDDNDLYIFSTETGEMLHRAGRLPAPIAGMCLSEDNRYLAVLMMNSQGLQVFDTASWQPVAHDDDYTGDTEHTRNCDFSTDGRLVTTSTHGYIRLYNNRFETPRLIKPAGGRHAHGVRFSPDGEKIAVGFSDSPGALVLSAHDLSELYPVNTANMKGSGSLLQVAWSADGQQLYAGGLYRSGRNQFAVVSWQQQGRAEPQVIGYSANSIFSLATDNEGRLVAASGVPEWLLFDSDNTQRQKTVTVASDYRWGGVDTFRISHTGNQVTFSTDNYSQPPVLFDLDTGMLTTDPHEQSNGLQPALTDAPWLSIPQRKDQTALLNNSKIRLEPREQLESWALAPDQNSVVLGTNWYLRQYNRSGEQQWQIATPGAAWRVNISGDGRTLIAAFSDGTLRWYRYSDGQELLALFVDRNSYEWVSWTPSGYYNASLNGDELIGWHKNNGRDSAADFYPVSQMRERYYRPDVVEQVLAVQSEQQALEQADQASGRESERATQPHANSLPPVIDLISPVEGQAFSDREITLRYRVRNAETAPLTKLLVRVDGRPLSGHRSLARKTPQLDSVSLGYEQQVMLQLPERDLTLTLIAENAYGTSPAASVRLKWIGQQNKQHIKRPRLYVLAAGISDYNDDALDTLKFTDEDARGFVSAVKAQGQFIYRDVVVKELIDVDSDALLDGLDWLRDEVTSNDVAMLFLAGHGLTDRDGDYFFLTRDADKNRLRHTAIEYHDIKKTLTALPGVTLAFIDSCHAGNIMGRRSTLPDMNRILQDLRAAENGVVVFASSTGKQYSLESAAWGHGAFTSALLSGMQGKADHSGDGVIDTAELKRYLADRVKHLTGNAQTPTVAIPRAIPDFPVFSVVPE